MQAEFTDEDQNGEGSRGNCCSGPAGAEELGCRAKMVHGGVAELDPLAPSLLRVERVFLLLLLVSFRPGGSFFV